MRVPIFGRAQAPVVFLAVSAIECVHIEQANFIQDVAAKVHAKADSRRHFDCLARVDRRKQAIQRAEAHVRWKRVGAVDSRVAAKCGVI